MYKEKMMVLDNGILHLELENKGGEMKRLLYKGYDVLYTGDSIFWDGKNPTLFPFISHYKGDTYNYDGHEYTCEKHGVIRNSVLTTIVENDNEVAFKLDANDYTIKRYPFNFRYIIRYRVEDSKVIINYEIENRDTKVMPFTFGIHPGFIVRDFTKTKLIFSNNEDAILFDYQRDKESNISLKEYDGEKILEDISKLETVMFKNLKSKYITLKMEEYEIKLDKSDFKYLALWTKNKDCKFLCLEPWISMNKIWESNTPFRKDFELEYLKPKEKFKIGYSFEIT